MSIMSDRWIRERAMEDGMIEPFVEGQRREGCISYGLSSYGYDARVADDFKIFTNVDNAIVDPKDFAQNSFVDRKLTSASSRRTASRWRGRWNISGCRATCS
jgi:dCTP deaminase